MMKPSWICIERSMLICLFVVFLSLKTQSKSIDNDVAERIDVIKSKNDDRNYRYLILKNKLRILLVSDQSVKKGAAAVSVNAGSSNDPKGVPGIAHFCEHMLFLGTKKYPEESGFQLFLSDHNGGTNAYTSAEYTVYHFDINYDFFEPALDRFAQFFISPTFNQNATDRELNAVDQEHQKNVLDDWRRIHYIKRASAKPDHSYGAFGTGNIDTLKTILLKEGISIRDMLLDFYNKYYSANIMTVAIFGKQTLDELEKMTVPMFKDVKNNNIELPSYKDNLPYGVNELKVALKIPTVKDIDHFEMTFQMFDLKKRYREKAVEYLSHTIGHKGKGSLSSQLKKRGWAYSLWARNHAGLKGFEFFTLSMDLTKNGMDHIDDIISTVFQYINMLRKEGPKQWIFDEMKAYSKIRFRYTEKVNLHRYVVDLVENMNLFNSADVLFGHYRYENFNSSLVEMILAKLVPENLRYLVASKRFENQTNNRMVNYFDAGYISEKIDKRKIKKWKKIGTNKELALPLPNPFIPDNLEIVVPIKNVTIKAIPKLIKDTKLSRVWFKADDTFYVPKADIKIGIYSAHASLTPSHYNHLELFSRLARYALVEYGYDAELASVQYSLGMHFTGFWVTVAGFSGKQDILLKKIMSHITSLEIDPKVFELQKALLTRELKNSLMLVPYVQTAYLHVGIMDEKTWNSNERLQYVEELTVDSLKRYMNIFLRDIYLESLFTGNVLEKDALKMINEVEQTLKERCKARPMLPIQHSVSREYIIPAGSSYLYEKRNSLYKFSAVQLYLQVGLQTLRNNVLCFLFHMMTHAPMFVQLRTQQQLGYIVFSYLITTKSVVGIGILVQSDKSPALVVSRIEGFLKRFEKKLEKMTDKQFRKTVDSAIVSKQEKPKRLSHETFIFANEIQRKSYDFHRKTREIEELKKLKKKDMLDFYKTYIDPASKLRKKLATIVLGRKHKSILTEENSSQWTPINNILGFKTNLSLYQNLLPVNGMPLVKN